MIVAKDENESEEYKLIQNVLTNKPYELKDFINDFSNHKNFLKEMIIKPQYLIIFSIWLTIILAARPVVSFISFFFFFLYLIKIIKFDKSLDYTSIQVDKARYLTKNFITWKDVIKLVFNRIPHYSGYTIAYYIYKKIKVGGKHKINYWNICRSIVIYTILGFSLWALVFAKKLAENSIDFFQMSKFNEFFLYRIPKIIVHELEINFNFFLKTSKKLRIYKLNNELRFNPTESSIIKQTHRSIKHGGNGCVVKSYTDKQRFISHPGLNLDETIDEMKNSEMCLIAQATGKPIEGMRTLKFSTKDYKKNESYLSYNTMQWKENIINNYDMRLYNSLRIAENAQERQLNSLLWMARVYDKEAGLWVEYKPKILPNIELPLNAKCKLGNLVMDDESVVYNILKLNAKLVKVETPGLSIQLLKK